MPIDFRSEVLLTGAGLTHNLGAPLASGLWAQIFSHPGVQGAPSLRRALIEQGFDFERSYEHVMTTETFSTEDRRALAEAVDAAFRRIDSVVGHFHMRNDSPILLGGYWQLVDQFAGDRNTKGADSGYT